LLAIAGRSKGWCFGLNWWSQREDFLFIYQG
jgi:hypothetical protein